MRRAPVGAPRHRCTPITGSPRRAARWNGSGRRWAPTLTPRPHGSKRWCATTALPAGAHALVIGLDRTTVPMEEPRSASATATTRRKARTTPYVRTAPGPVDVHYRMAYVGTVSVVDRAGAALVTRRYAIPSTADPATVTARMMADVRRARVQAPRLPVGVVQDGAPELWTLIRTALTTGTRLRHWHEAVDAIT
jgi:hypothetical protein